MISNYTKDSSWKKKTPHSPYFKGGEKVQIVRFLCHPNVILQIKNEAWQFSKYGYKEV
jgi:hypothetical protein